MAKVFDEKMMKSTKKGINNRAPRVEERGGYGESYGFRGNDEDYFTMTFVPLRM